MKCLCVLCFDGKEYVSDVRDTTCCKDSDGNAWYADGETFQDQCDIYTCTNGSIQFIQTSDECCVGPDDKWYKNGQYFYDDNCVEYQCLAGVCVTTGSPYSKCCQGDMGYLENFETYQYKCDVFMCFYGNITKIESNVDTCCHDKEGDKYVADNAIYHMNCIEYQCQDGEAVPTGNKTPYCCYDATGAHYGNGITYISGCNVYNCKDGVPVEIDIDIDECCIDSLGNWYRNGEEFSDGCIDYICDGGMSMPNDTVGHISRQCCQDGYGHYHADWELYRYRCQMYECRKGQGVPLYEVEDCCFSSNNMTFANNEIFSDHCTDWLCDHGEHVFKNFPSDQCCMDGMMNWHSNFITYIFDCGVYKCIDGKNMLMDYPYEGCCKDETDVYHMNGETYDNDCQKWLCNEGQPSFISGLPCEQGSGNYF